MQDNIGQIREGIDKTKKIGLTIFLIIAAFLLITGIMDAVEGIKCVKGNSDSYGDYETVSATISDIVSEKKGTKYTYNVYVTYTLYGKTFENIPYNVYSSDMYIGKTIEILCNPEYPTDIEAKEGLDLYSIFYFGSAGIKILMAIIIGVIMINALRKMARKGTWLVKNGLKLTGTVESIQPVGQPYPDGQTDYLVYCTYSDMVTGMTYRFKSKIISSIQASYYYQGMPIDVYVNPKDYSQYYVNINLRQSEIQ